MFKYLILLLIVAPLGATFAADEVGADGFPADWTAEDFSIAAGQISETKQPVSVPKTMRIEEMGRVSITPSGSMPVALPPVIKTSDTSNGYYRPLGAAFDGTVESVSGSETSIKNNDLALLAGFGVLSAETGGAPKDVWVSSGYMAREGRAALLRAGLSPNGQAVPNVASLGLREGWRRLLLSAADAPSGTTVNGKGNWLAVRATILEGLGLHEAALSLWRQVGKEARAGDETLALGWAGATLLAGDAKAACGEARSKAAARADDAWTAVVAACAAVEAATGGNAQALGLSMQLVSGVEANKRPVLMGLLEGVRDGKPMTIGAVPWDSLAGAVGAAYPILVSGSEMSMVPDVTLRRVRDSAALPVELRTRAGRALAGKTAAIADGIGLVNLVSGGVIGASTPDAAAVAWGLNSKREIEVTGGQAGQVVKAALRLGDVGTAKAWWGRWTNSASLNLDERKQVVQSEVVLRAMEGSEVSETLLRRWLVAQPLSNAEGAKRAQRMLLSIEGLGMPVPAVIWSEYRARAVKAGDGVDAAWKKALDGAVEQHDVPGVILLVTEGLNGKGANEGAPGVVGDSIAALRAVGMADIAGRMLAEQESKVVEVAVPVQKVSATTVSATTPVSATVKASATTVKAPLTELPPPRVQAPKKPTPPVKPVAKP